MILVLAGLLLAQFAATLRAQQVPAMARAPGPVFRLPPVEFVEPTGWSDEGAGSARPQRLPALPPPDAAPAPPSPRDILPRPAADGPAAAPAPGGELPVPAPWWQTEVARPFQPTTQPQPIDLDTAIVEALRHSPQVRAISDQRLIREASIIEAEALFDVRAFMDSRFVRTSEPVGNLLITGGPPRFREEDWRYSAGVRKRTGAGGIVELSQRIGLQDNNSVFFVPEQQGNARLALSFSQPLLNGAGRAYNNSLVVLAQIDADIATAQTSRQLQDHLYQVMEAYWELYAERAVYLQRKRFHERVLELLLQLENRQAIDALDSQIARARAAVATRSAEMIRAQTAVKNAEARLRFLVDHPQWSEMAGRLELVPQQTPVQERIQVHLQEGLQTALRHRPELDEAMRQVHAASVRLEMSKNELLPMLNAVVETYVMGLRGEQDIGNALADQFQEGEPSYTAGLIFEMPWQNRAAKARYQRRKLELRQVTEQFRATMLALRTEVEVAIREVETAYRELHARARSMEAAASDVEYIQRRWELLPGDDRSASFVLEDLLEAQNRLALEELGYSRAQFAYTVSLAALKRATGTLLQCEGVSASRVREGDLPQIIFRKDGME